MHNPFYLSLVSLGARLVDASDFKGASECLRVACKLANDGRYTHASYYLEQRVLAQAIVNHPEFAGETPRDAVPTDIGLQSGAMYRISDSFAALLLQVDCETMREDIVRYNQPMQYQYMSLATRQFLSLGA